MRPGSQYYSALTMQPLTQSKSRGSGKEASRKWAQDWMPAEGHHPGRRGSEYLAAFDCQEGWEGESEGASLLPLGWGNYPRGTSPDPWGWGQGHRALL